jgi:hypothetical protein
MARLPTRKQPVEGQDLDGNDVVLAVGVSRRLYRCPSCRNSLQIGEEHVIVRRREEGGRGYHQHWHTSCATELAREIEITRNLGREG